MKESDTVKIYTATGEGNAKVIKSFLEDNGIEVLIKIDSSGDAIFGNMGGNSPISNWEIYVLEDKEKKAKELLKEFKNKD